MFTRTNIVILYLVCFVVAVQAAPLPTPRKPEPGDVVEVEIRKGVKMKFCWIPAGEAQLGSPVAEREGWLKQSDPDAGDKWLKGAVRSEAEEKRGRFMTKGFWLGKYPVTQEQWESVMGNNPSFFSKQGKGKDKVQGMETSRFPVEQVSWDDCQTFVKNLNGKVAIPIAPGKGKFAAPHEDQWEYACRGGNGNKLPFYFGQELNGTQANCIGEYPCGTSTKGAYLGRTTEVGSYEKVVPHPWGLCDMHGNVWQRCKTKPDDKKQPSILRGGSWNAFSGDCRSASRYFSVSWVYKYDFSGFRVAVLP